MTSTEPLKLTQLRTLLREMESVLVCFSGGIDSALLLAIAHQELGAKAIGMTAVSPSLPQSEKEAASAIARELGATHRLVESNEIARDGYVANGPDRCFHCKTELYDIAARKQLEWGLAAVANGTNQDDLGDYRPGLQAAALAQVRSPFLDVGMTKSDVREAAHFINLKSWDKPAAACLSSRIPYGVAVTRERLSQVEGFESALHNLGFREVRVRWHNEIARIEVPTHDLARFTAPEVHATVVELGRMNGFQYITLDLAGYRTGSLNELLSGRSLKVIRD